MPLEYKSLIAGRGSPSERARALLGESLAKELMHRSSEVRKSASRELEKKTKSTGADSVVYESANVLIEDYLSSADSNARKGGLIGLVSLLLAFDANEQLLELAFTGIRSRVRDVDPRVRYYTCEALYNVIRKFPSVCRPELLDDLHSFLIDTNAEIRRAASFLEQVIWEEIALIPQREQFINMVVSRLSGNNILSPIPLKWLSRFTRMCRISTAQLERILECFASHKSSAIDEPLLDLEASIRASETPSRFFPYLLQLSESQSALYLLESLVKHGVPLNILERVVRTGLTGIALYPSLNESLLERFTIFPPSSEEVLAVKAALVELEPEPLMDKALLRWFGILPLDRGLMRLLVGIKRGAEDDTTRRTCNELLQSISVVHILDLVEVLGDIKTEDDLNENLGIFRDFIIGRDCLSVYQGIFASAIPPFFPIIALFALPELMTVRSEVLAGSASINAEFSRGDICADFLFSLFVGNSRRASSALARVVDEDIIMWKWRLVARVLLTRPFAPTWAKVEQPEVNEALRGVGLLVCDCEEQRALFRKLHWADTAFF